MTIAALGSLLAGSSAGLIPLDPRPPLPSCRHQRGDARSSRALAVFLIPRPATPSVAGRIRGLRKGGSPTFFGGRCSTLALLGEPLGRAAKIKIARNAGRLLAELFTPRISNWPAAGRSEKPMVGLGEGSR